jgi:hypothetical protein
MTMQSLLRASALAASAVACLTTSAFAGGGEPHGVGASMTEGVSRTEAAGPARKLLSTYSTTNNGGGSVLAAATFNVVDTTVVNCTAAAGCRIGLDALVQIAPAAGDWAICLYVDGLSAGCPYQGVQGIGTFVVGNYNGFSGTVSNGLHTVEMKVFPNNAANLYRWTVNYRVYKGA